MNQVALKKPYYGNFHVMSMRELGSVFTKSSIKPHNCWLTHFWPIFPFFYSLRTPDVFRRLRDGGDINGTLAKNKIL